MNWYEHIRKRPGMYLGATNQRGFINVLREVLAAQAYGGPYARVGLVLTGPAAARLAFEAPPTTVQQVPGRAPYWVLLSQNLEVLNALSERFYLDLMGPAGQLQGRRHYRKGREVAAEAFAPSAPSLIHATFQLDPDIWGEAFCWNPDFLQGELRTFAYLNPGLRLDLAYRVAEVNCRCLFQYDRGLRDCIEIEILRGSGGAYCLTEIDLTGEGWQLRGAFAFREYSVDAAFLQSYVNQERSPDHGTHVDGFLRGLARGLSQYFREQLPIDPDQVLERRIRENIVAALHLQIAHPHYRGAVKHQLANPEVVEPIVQDVATAVFERLGADPDLAKRVRGGLLQNIAGMT
ncbi:MAG: hypothetical protein AAF146_19805 [Bacteroidota bacterium]